ncbi:MAG: hypothetical protein LBP28_06360, partial [Coriobacteriales bacterium]|nr:hypothetical protein [Coriobacteriales bacterium]
MKKRTITIAAVAVAILAICVGGWVGHEDPRFCAICHTPMNNYVEGYYATPGEPTLDRSGKAVADASALLVSTHADAGVTCLDCHTANVSQQMGELGAWVSGEYNYPLGERTLVELLEGAHQPIADAQGSNFCLVEGCHVSPDGKSLGR